MTVEEYERAYAAIERANFHPIGFWMLEQMIMIDAITRQTVAHDGPSTDQPETKP